MSKCDICAKFPVKYRLNMSIKKPDTKYKLKRHRSDMDFDFGKVAPKIKLGQSHSLSFVDSKKIYGICVNCYHKKCHHLDDFLPLCK